jgi:uncharacterized protein
MIIADTGFWVALIDQKDSYHAKAEQALQNYNEPLITTWPVMTETCYLLQRNQGASVASSFIQSFGQGLFSVFPLQQSHATSMSQLMLKW